MTNKTNMFGDWDGVERRISEEERRKVCFLHQEQIHEIESDIKKNEAKIGVLEVFRGRAEIVGVIAVIIFIGSFTYTKYHKDDARVEFTSIKANVARNAERIFDNRGDYKVVMADLRNLIKTVDESNRQLSKIADSMSKESKYGEQKEL